MDTLESVDSLAARKLPDSVEPQLDACLKNPAMTLPRDVFNPEEDLLPEDRSGQAHASPLIAKCGAEDLGHFDADIRASSVSTEDQSTNTFPADASHSVPDVPSETSDHCLSVSETARVASEDEDLSVSCHSFVDSPVGVSRKNEEEVGDHHSQSTVCGAQENRTDQEVVVGLTPMQQMESPGTVPVTDCASVPPVAPLNHDPLLEPSSHLGFGQEVRFAEDDECTFEEKPYPTGKQQDRESNHLQGREVLPTQPLPFPTSYDCVSSLQEPCRDSSSWHSSDPAAVSQSFNRLRGFEPCVVFPKQTTRNSFPQAAPALPSEAAKGILRFQCPSLEESPESFTAEKREEVSVLPPTFHCDSSSDSPFASTIADDSAQIRRSAPQAMPSSSSPSCGSPVHASLRERLPIHASVVSPLSSAPAPLPVLSRPPELSSLFITASAVASPSRVPLGPDTKDPAGDSVSRRSIAAEVHAPGDLPNTPPSTPQGANGAMLGHRVPPPQDRPRRPMCSGAPLTYCQPLQSLSSRPGALTGTKKSEAERLLDARDDEETEWKRLRAKFETLRQQRREEMERQLRLDEERDERELQQLQLRKKRVEKGFGQPLAEGRSALGFPVEQEKVRESQGIDDPECMLPEERESHLLQVVAEQTDSSSYIPNRNQTAVFGSGTHRITETDLEPSLPLPQSPVHTAGEAKLGDDANSSETISEGSHDASKAVPFGPMPETKADECESENQGQTSLLPPSIGSMTACVGCRAEDRLPSFGGHREQNDHFEQDPEEDGPAPPAQQSCRSAGILVPEISSPNTARYPEHGQQAVIYSPTSFQASSISETNGGIRYKKTISLSPSDVVPCAETVTSPLPPRLPVALLSGTADGRTLSPTSTSGSPLSSPLQAESPLSFPESSHAGVQSPLSAAEEQLHYHNLPTYSRNDSYLAAILNQGNEGAYNNPGSGSLPVGNSALVSSMHHPVTHAGIVNEFPGVDSAAHASCGSRSAFVWGSEGFCESSPSLQLGASSLTWAPLCSPSQALSSLRSPTVSKDLDASASSAKPPSGSTTPRVISIHPHSLSPHPASSSRTGDSPSSYSKTAGNYCSHETATVSPVAAYDQACQVQVAGVPGQYQSMQMPDSFLSKTTAGPGTTEADQRVAATLSNGFDLNSARGTASERTKEWSEQESARHVSYKVPHEMRQDILHQRGAPQNQICRGGLPACAATLPLQTSPVPMRVPSSMAGSQMSAQYRMPSQTVARNCHSFHDLQPSRGYYTASVSSVCGRYANGDDAVSRGAGKPFQAGEERPGAVESCVLHAYAQTVTDSGQSVSGFPHMPQHLGPFVAVTCSQGTIRPFKRTTRCRGRKGSRPLSPQCGSGTRPDAAFGCGTMTSQAEMCLQDDFFPDEQAVPPYAPYPDRYEAGFADQPFAYREAMQHDRVQPPTPRKRFLGGTTRLFGGLKTHRPFRPRAASAADNYVGLTCSQLPLPPLSSHQVGSASRWASLARFGEDLVGTRLVSNSGATYHANSQPLKGALPQPRVEAIFIPHPPQRKDFPPFAVPSPIMLPAEPSNEQNVSPDSGFESPRRKSSRVSCLAGTVAAAARETLSDVGEKLIGEVGSAAARGGTMVRQIASMLQRGFDTLVEGESYDARPRLPRDDKQALEHDGSAARFDGDSTYLSALHAARRHEAGCLQPHERQPGEVGDERFGLLRSAWFTASSAEGAEEQIAYREGSLTQDGFEEALPKPSKMQRGECHRDRSACGAASGGTEVVLPTTTTVRRPLPSISFSGTKNNLSGSPDFSWHPAESPEPSREETRFTRPFPPDKNMDRQPWVPPASLDQPLTQNLGTDFAGNIPESRGSTCLVDCLAYGFDCASGDVAAQGLKSVHAASGFQNSEVPPKISQTFSATPSASYVKVVSGGDSFSETGSNLVGKTQSFYLSPSASVTATDHARLPVQNADFCSPQRQAILTHDTCNNAQSPQKALSPHSSFYLPERSIVRPASTSQVSNGQTSVINSEAVTSPRQPQHEQLGSEMLQSNQRRLGNCPPSFHCYELVRGRSLPAVEGVEQTEALRQKYEACDSIVGRWKDRYKSARGL
ncbi:putative platelet-binding protein GspB [Toxoplasma gondii VAND]|uniref:Putative platelet-binding protein GspB n=1 Tax=Toxoplasma gondii VAND TaxID=933077 RepID=A0A086QAB2_TOXGO|nr:putative platelet-binding protein GspB [Toxoplasma gondii VAND]